jgi:hypothetical protein
MFRFYGYFAAAYGTIWFCLMLAAVVSQSHINAGAFGLYGFPVIALIYAIIRSFAASDHASELELLRGRVRRLEAELSDRT